MQEKIFIKNRKGQKIAVLIEKPKNPKGLAFVMHGLGGFKEQPHIETFARTFFDNDYTSVRFDTTNTLGESDGDYENATLTNYYGDLEDVISWAEAQDWYQEPFILAGHSLGGICSALYAQKYPQKVKALAPVSSVVSGKLSLQAEDTKDWQEKGWREDESRSKPGVMKRLPWSHMEDRLKYDLLPDTNKLTMLILLIVGEVDNTTPLAHQQLLYEKLPGKKEIYIIKGAPHTFREKKHLDEIHQIFDRWIKSL